MTAKAQKSPSIDVTGYQARLLQLPEQFDVFLGGGRGGGKSYALALMALSHIERYGSKANVLYIRHSFPALRDFESTTRDLFSPIYGKTASFNQQDRIWRFPNGGTLELNQIGHESDYLKFQGRSFSLIMIDEAGEFADPHLIDLLRSNLRAKDVICRMVVAANPGGSGHGWISSRWVTGRSAWEPFEDDKSGTMAVLCPSTYRDNPHINQKDYRRQLESATSTDLELQKAWIDGEWAIARGAFFSSVLDPRRVGVPKWRRLPEDVGEYAANLMPHKRTAFQDPEWLFFLSHDWGSAAPSATYLCARSPGATHEEIFYPRGSIILVDEFATDMPDNPNKGRGFTVPEVASRIKGMVASWGMSHVPRGAADDAIFSKHGFSAGSIADEFELCGIHFFPAQKGSRAGGWEKMRRMFQDAGELDRPGLYVAENCRYFWQTVPSLPRDRRNPGDVDSDAPDHAADAVRYALTWRKPDARVVKLGGI